MHNVVDRQELDQNKSYLLELKKRTYDSHVLFDRDVQIQEGGVCSDSILTVSSLRSRFVVYITDMRF